MSAQNVSAVRLSRPASREDERRRDQRVGIFTPDSLLRLPIKHAQHPVMAGKVREIPRDGSIRLPECISAVDQCDVVEFGTSNALGLQDSKQAGVMQIALGFRRQAPQFFRIGTGGTAGTYYPIGGLLANAISNPPGSRPCEDGGSCGAPGLVASATRISNST